jgi:hypothetical protein
MRNRPQCGCACRVAVCDGALLLTEKRVLAGGLARSVRGRRCLMPLCEQHEPRGSDLQSDRESQHRSDRGVELASLNRADVVAMQPGGVAERFLAEAAVDAELSYGMSERAVAGGLGVSGSHAC